MRLDREYAEQLDQGDPLAPFRDRFAPIEDGLIYLDGNSLGRMPKSAKDQIMVAASVQWGERLVRGWGEGWYETPRRLGAKIARLIGAQEDEVIVCDSTSVDFFKLVCAALAHQTPRGQIVTDDLNFPSDIYLLQGIAHLASTPKHPTPNTQHPAFSHMQPRGEGVLRVVHARDAMTVSEGELRDAVSQDTALLTLSHTSFKSAFVHDMARVTKIAHDAGALMLWDLSHSVGAMPIELNECGADLAVGCTYKYLNGGPGSPAFLYVRRDLQDKLQSPIWGWFGQSRPFDFELDYEPAPGIARFLAGTPPILAICAIEAGVDMVAEAGIERIREKSATLTEYMIALWEAELQPLDFRLQTPRDPAIRGSHVSLGHDEGWRINRALIEDMNVIPDFRQPDNIRFGLVPLYTSFVEVHEAVARLRRVIEERTFEKYPAERATVT